MDRVDAADEHTGLVDYSNAVGVAGRVELAASADAFDVDRAKVEFVRLESDHAGLVTAREDETDVSVLVVGRVAGDEVCGCCA